MSLLVPLGALALLAIPAIVLLYFLKVRRPEVRVATAVTSAVVRSILPRNNLVSFLSERFSSF